MRSMCWLWFKEERLQCATKAVNMHVRFNALTPFTLRAKLSGAVYCYRSCLWRAGGRAGWRVGGVCGWVCLWVCYHDKSKLHASIFTKLGLYVKVVTVSSWLNFGRPAPPGRGLWRGKNFWVRLTTASAQCLRLFERFFHIILGSRRTFGLYTSYKQQSTKLQLSETFGNRRNLESSIVVWIEITLVRQIGV